MISNYQSMMMMLIVINDDNVMKNGDVMFRRDSVHALQNKAGQTSDKNTEIQSFMALAAANRVVDDSIPSTA